MQPLRLSICTYNLWNIERWPEREPALRDFLRRHRPDILGVQELQPETRDCIDAELAGHARVVDDLPGWHREGNIWWHTGLFSEVEHGAADIGLIEVDRRLFWVRLRRADGEGTVLVATMHLTHARAREEAASGHSPRVGQTRAAMAALGGIVQPGEPAWLMGDFNDAIHASVLLHEEGGWRSCFADLNVQPPATFPALPTAGWKPGGHVTCVCYDWITASGPARPLCAASPHTFINDLAPSDHWPVVAVYEI